MEASIIPASALWDGARFRRTLDGQTYQVAEREKGTSPFSATRITAVKIRRRRLLGVSFGWTPVRKDHAPPLIIEIETTEQVTPL
jgi:hypothetical protein